MTVEYHDRCSGVTRLRRAVDRNGSRDRRKRAVRDRRSDRVRGRDVEVDDAVDAVGIGLLDRSPERADAVPGARLADPIPVSSVGLVAEIVHRVRVGGVSRRHGQPVHERCRDGEGEELRAQRLGPMESSKHGLFPSLFDELAEPASLSRPSAVKR